MPPATQPRFEFGHESTDIGPKVGYATSARPIIEHGKEGGNHHRADTQQEPEPTARPNRARPRRDPGPMTTRYRFEPDSCGAFRIVDHECGTVDIVLTLSSAEYDVRMLNTDAARINRHAVVGCRVEVQS